MSLLDFKPYELEERLANLSFRNDLKISYTSFNLSHNMPRWCSGLACESVTLTTRVQIPTEAPNHHGSITQFGRVLGFYEPHQETALMLSFPVQRYQGAAGSNPVGPTFFCLPKRKDAYHSAVRNDTVMSDLRRPADEKLGRESDILKRNFLPAENFVKKDLGRCKL